MKHHGNIVEKEHPMSAQDVSKGMGMMLLHEDLARARMQARLELAEQHRLAKRMAAVNRWRRLSRWAAQRASQAACAL
jgi:hypothetical protein